MADTFGHVTMAVPAIGTAAEVLYTCPEIASVDVSPATDIVTAAQFNVVQTQVVSIHVANVDGSGAANFYMWIREASTDAAPVLVTDNAVAIYYGISVAQLTATTFNPGMLLSSGNTLWIGANAAGDLTATINYIEIS